MKQAESLRGRGLGMLLPGIALDTGPPDYFPVELLQMLRLAGERRERPGPGPGPGPAGGVGR